MKDDGLLSIEIDTRHKIATFIYEWNADYDTDEIIAYVADMNCGRIIVLEGISIMHNLFKVKDGWIEGAEL